MTEPTRDSQIRKEGIGMKFVKVIYHSIFNEGILNLMKQLDIHEFVDCQRICAEDEDGRHFGVQAWTNRSSALPTALSRLFG
jgi:hypothetical protein